VSGIRRLDRLILLPVRSEEPPADESAFQRQECLVDVISLFVANAQAAKLIEPGKGSLYDPPPSTQPAAVFDVSLGEPRPNPTNS